MATKAKQRILGLFLGLILLGLTAGMGGCQSVTHSYEPPFPEPTSPRFDDRPRSPTMDPATRPRFDSAPRFDSSPSFDSAPRFDSPPRFNQPSPLLRRPPRFAGSLSTKDMAITLPETVEVGESHALVVARLYHSPTEERLLRIAESLYPPFEEIFQAARQSNRALPRTDFRTVTTQPEPVWWYDERDGLRVPYAVTAGAARYYVLAISSARLGEPVGERGALMQRSTFDYRAVIDEHAEFVIGEYGFENVFVATLEMMYSGVCGAGCGLSFKRERTVVLSRNGEPLAVFGDGPI